MAKLPDGINVYSGPVLKIYHPVKTFYWDWGKQSDELAGTVEVVECPQDETCKHCFPNWKYLGIEAETVSGEEKTKTFPQKEFDKLYDKLSNPTPNIVWGEPEGESDWSKPTYTQVNQAQMYKQQEAYKNDNLHIAPNSGEEFEKWMGETGEQVSTEEANLISSKIHKNAITDDGEKKHRPVLDLDFRCELVPSSTPGHFHLYMDKYLTWDQYTYLLYALSKIGLVQETWVRASMQRGMSMVRKPGVSKADLPEHTCNCPHCPTSNLKVKEPF